MSDSGKQWNVITAVVVLLCVAAVIAVILLPALSAPRINSSPKRSISNLRGVTQSMVFFGNDNNDYWPGLSSNGEVLAGAAVQASGAAQTGASFHARMWMLLNGQFIGGDLLLNQQDMLTKWTSGNNCTSMNVSYAGLQIGDSSTATNTIGNTSRAAEWKNNANSQAIVMSDRLLNASDTADTAVQSVWTTSKGDWKGGVVWADTHAGHETTWKGFTTRYSASKNTLDNLFVPSPAPWATEGSVDASANAMMVYY